MKHAAILCLGAIAAPAAADVGAPRSLQMRAPRRPSPIVVGQAAAPPPADDAPAPPPADDAPAEPPAKPTGDESTARPPATRESGKTEIISVIDSPIEHELLTGRVPATVVTRADLAASGHATLGDILQSLPSQSNGGNAQVNAGGDGTTRINLRGLGVARTLVLLNGRRMVNGGRGADAAVDLNAIPLAAIERVEVLKDGASAIYGADAVGGVVNLVTRPKFDGADVSLLTSTSQHGDGTEYDASFVTGFTTRDKRTYLVVSGGAQRHDAVFAGDRSFSTFPRTYDFAARREIANGSSAAPGGRLDASSIGSGGFHIAGCPSDVCKPDGNGGWTDFAPPADLYNDAPGNQLYTPSWRAGILATGGNRIFDNAAVLVELLYWQRHSERELSPVAFDADTRISKDSLYNPFGEDVLDYRRRILEAGPRTYSDDVNTFRLVLGITGGVPESSTLFRNWNYEVSYTYALTGTRGTTGGQLLDPHLADALGPSMLDPSGAPICVRKPGELATQIVYVSREITPCVPLNLLMASGPIPSDQLKNLTYNDAIIGSDALYTALATASGPIVELPNHGGISLTLGTDYRREFGEQLAEVASVGYSTDNAEGQSRGRFHMFEGFGDLAIVPITGHDIAKRVELDLGARALYHNRFGSSLTYKATGLFRTVHGLAARGTYATAFRAPSMPELFRGVSERNTTAEDPCDTKPPSAGEGMRTLDPAVQDLCTAQGVPLGSKFTTGQQVSVVGGSPDLKAETANTVSIGIVFEPPQLKGVALTADYWHINIRSAIETLGVQTILANCYDRGVQSYCDQIHRDFYTHRINPVDQLLQNVHRTTTSGIDLALWYDTKLAEYGELHTGLESQYLLRYDVDTSLQVIHGVGYYDLGVYPRYKANLSSHWAHPSGASGGFTLRYVGSYKECADNNCNNGRNLAIARDVGRYAKLDLFGGYDFRTGLGRTALQLGINNALNATPPLIYNAAAANSDAATYDFIGRMVYLRASQLF